MKKHIAVLSVVLAFCLALPLAAQGGTEASGGGADKGEPASLVVSTWGLSEDDLWDQVYTPFEEKYNAKVTLDIGNGQERYLKMTTDPNSTVDVIELAQRNTADGVAAGAFAPLSPSDITDFDSLIPAAKQLIESGSGAPYTLNSIGIVYDPKVVGFEIKEWKDLWDPRLKGQIAIPNITTTFGPAFVTMASDVYGGDIAQDKGETGFKALEDLLPNVATTYSRSSDVVNLLQNGEITVAIIGDFGLPVVQKAMPDVIFAVPASGTYANFNIINISKNCKNRDLALKYINWRLDAETEMRTAKVLNEAPVNTKCELTPELAQNKTVGEVAAKAKVVDFTVVNPLMADWVDRFNRLMKK